MELKETLIAISDDARSWLKTWARDFSDAEAVQPRSDPRAPNPLPWHLGHLACVEDEVTRLFTTGEPVRASSIRPSAPCVRRRCTRTTTWARSRR